MLIPTKECIERLELFTDSHVLADQLIGLAADRETTSPSDAYILKEAAQNVLGLFDLARSMAIHLRPNSKAVPTESADAQTLMIQLAVTPAENWVSYTGNYGVKTCVSCAWCGGENSITLTGESHDEEPSVFEGLWLCEKCPVFGSWKGAQHDVIGPTGISTPGNVRLASWQA